MNKLTKDNVEQLSHKALGKNEVRKNKLEKVRIMEAKSEDFNRSSRRKEKGD